MTISENFNSVWNFPHCIGALDGKHIEVVKPKHSGSLYFNYKKTFSVVLLALVDANYQFIYVDCGIQGRISDGGVFNHSSLGKLLQQRKLRIPEPTALTTRPVLSPYVIVADDAFALDENLLKPYNGSHAKGSCERIFNYRLSRARRIVENAFGILSAVFRVFKKPINLEPPKVQKIVMACVALHNYIRRNTVGRNVYSPPGTFDAEDLESGVTKPGSWRDTQIHFLPLQRIPRRSSDTAKDIRKEFAEYFISDAGKVPWQDRFS